MCKHNSECDVGLRLTSRTNSRAGSVATSNFTSNTGSLHLNEKREGSCWKSCRQIINPCDMKIATPTSACSQHRSTTDHHGKKQMITDTPITSSSEKTIFTTTQHGLQLCKLPLTQNKMHNSRNMRNSTNTACHGHSSAKLYEQ